MKNLVVFFLLLEKSLKHIHHSNSLFMKENQNWWKWRSLKIFARTKGREIRQNGGDFSRNEGLPYYIEIFLEIDKFIFPLLTNMCYKIISATKYEIIGIVAVLIVLTLRIAVLIIHANNKHSPWYFYLSYLQDIVNNFLNKLLTNYFSNNFLNLFYILL